MSDLADRTDSPDFDLVDRTVDAAHAPRLLLAADVPVTVVSVTNDGYGSGLQISDYPGLRVGRDVDAADAVRYLRKHGFAAYTLLRPPHFQEPRAFVTVDGQRWLVVGIVPARYATPAAYLTQGTGASC